MNNQNASRKRATRTRAVGWFTLFAVVGWLAASAHAGSVFTTFYTFTGTNDGANPNGLVQGSDGFLYGTSTDAGGSLQVYVARVKGELITNSYYGSGTVFKISTNGALSTLYVFGPVTNADHGPLDGAAPNAGLVQGSDGYFYGTTYAGGTSISLGTSGYGTVFKSTTNGVLTSLYSFADANDGANPVAALVQGSDGNLYGTTEGDGTYTYNYGTVFEISTNGALTSLYSFDGYDGAIPRGSLVQGSDGNFYGTTWLGGTGFDVYSDNTAYGTVFKISTNGSLTSLHTFDYTGYGSTPSAGLALGSDGNFYGSTSGGFLEEPSLFKISANGVFTNLYSFTGSGRVIGPSAKLVQGGDGGLYGTTKSGGANNSGAVFKINPDGTGFTTLYTFSMGTLISEESSFVTNSDGAFPQAALILVGNTLYGTTSGGGTNGFGTVFSLTLPGPQLNITPSEGSVVLSWPTNSALTLESTTNLGPAAVWNSVSPAPVIVNGQNIVTNPMTGAQQFFRLFSP